MNKDEINKLLEELYMSMCAGCPNERACHNNCENCDEYTDEYLRITGEQK